MTGLVGCDFAGELDGLDHHQVCSDMRLLERSLTRHYGGSKGWVNFWLGAAKVFLVSLRWPWAVGINLGKCLRKMGLVSPGQVVKRPLSMAFVHVSTTGLQAQRWK